MEVDRLQQIAEDLAAAWVPFEKRFSMSPGAVRHIDPSRFPKPEPPKPAPQRPQPEPFVAARTVPVAKKRSGLSGKAEYRPKELTPCQHCGHLFKRTGRQLFCESRECRAAHTVWAHEQLLKRTEDRRRENGIAPRQPPRVLVPKDECPHDEWGDKGFFKDGKTRKQWCLKCKRKYRKTPTSVASSDAR